ncbi:MAG: hypothetical protein NT105_23300 [Verrucomicrobia bacterium]|nr:hypothetical protein [Verrucomicrobiota bacterium]
MEVNCTTPSPSNEHRIEVNLRDVNQLFNTMDPSPFHEKDLDHDAEEFIESWAQELPVNEPVSLIVHVNDLVPEKETQQLIEKAVHNHFANRARSNEMEFRQLMAEGRRTLLIGLAFISTCLFVAARFFPGGSAGTISAIVRESLTIGGWVAMWRPLEIYLYQWWPLQKRGKIFQKLAQMPVEVRTKTNSDSSNP